MINKIVSIGDFHSHAKKKSHVSFDLFDTILRRRYLKVNEVHDTVSAFILSRLGLLNKHSPMDFTLLRYRMSDAMKSNDGGVGSTQEPLIDDVWDRIVSRYIGDAALRQSIVKDAVAFEQAIELANLALVPGAKDLLVKLQTSNKVVIAISDMYFNTDYLCAVLHKLGVRSIFDHVYVSADRRVTKQTGDLFKVVLEELGISSRDIVHVGDNVNSDVGMAEKNGIDAVLVEQHHQMELERPAYGTRVRIEEDVADIVKLHLFSLMFDAQTRRVDKIFFMARDGCTISAFLERWNSPFLGTHINTPAHADLYLNRILSCWGGIDFSGDWLSQSVGLAFWLNHGKATAAELSELLGFARVPRELGTATLDVKADTTRVVQILRASGADVEIRASIIQKRSTLARYLQEIGFFASKSLAFSDVGYSGTVLRDLNGLFLNRAADEGAVHPPHMVLHLIATNDHFAENRPRAYPFVDFYENVVLPAAKLPSELKGSFSWLEYFFKHRTLEPILRFVEEDGRLSPELRHGQPVAEQMPSDRLIDFAIARDEDIALLWMAAVNFSGQVIDPIIDRFANPDSAMLEQMADPVFEKHSVQGTRRSILLEVPGGRKEAITVAATEGDYWIPGSLLASETASPPESDLSTTTKERFLDRFFRRAGAARAPKFADELDTKFYGTFYADLRHMTSDAQLVEHWLRHGRSENRLPTAAALRLQLEAEFGPAPEDFDPEGYLLHNGDLASRIASSDQALDHFMRFGRQEGRTYRSNRDDLVDAFDRLLADRVIELSPAERKFRDRGETALTIFLRRHRVRLGRWIDEIDVAEFRALNYEWCGPVRDLAECIVTLLENGLHRSVALSLRTPFDPAFYRRQSAALSSQLQNLSDDDLYRHYLNEASVLGLAPSEAGRLFKLWGRCEFPQAFDWTAYARSLRQGSSHMSRTDVLEKFVNDNSVDPLKYVKGDRAAQFIEFLAFRTWHKAGRAVEARKLFMAALDAGASQGRIHHIIGDSYLHAGDFNRALTHFRAGIASGTGDRWSFFHAAKLLLERGDFQSALDVLEAGENLWQVRAPWRGLYVQAAQAKCKAILHEVLRPANRCNDLSALDLLVAEIRDRLPAITPLSGGNRKVLLLTSLPLPTLGSDRDTVAAADILVHASGTETESDLLGAMLESDIVVFHNTELTYPTLRKMLLAKSLGKRTIAWIGRLASFEGHRLDGIDWDDRSHDQATLRQDNLPLIALGARYCDEVVTPLAGCRSLLERVAPAVPIRSPAAVPRVGQVRKSQRHVILVTTGRGLSTASLATLAGKLCDASGNDARLHFLIGTDLAAQPALRDIVGKWSSMEDNPGLCDLASMIATVDSVLVASIDDGAPYYASDAEASAIGIGATVVRLRARDRKAGRADDDATRIDEAMRELLSDTGRPDRSEGAKYWTIRADSADDHVSASRLLSDCGSKKPRILFANVFFPPQLIGGATRVLKDNIDYFIDRHADAFELAVFTGDEQNDRNGEWRLDTYRGIPVVRVATPQEIHMDWRPSNAQVGAKFEATLRAYRPHFVHIHCLQRLSVTVAEACLALKIPYVITLHDAWWISDFPFLSDENGMPTSVNHDYYAQKQLPAVSIKDSVLRAERLRRTLLGAKRRLAVSESFASIYREAGIPCETIENGISRIERIKRTTVGNRVRLCHIGGLQHHKGAYLVEVALRTHDLPNLHLTIVDLARDKGDEFNTIWGSTPVTITGKMSTPEVAELYAQTDVLLAPSTWSESYGLVTREALAHGLWVIAGNRGAMGDPVVDGINGFVVTVENASGISEALGKINSDIARFRQPPPVPQSLRTVDQQSADLVQIYRELLNDVDHGNHN